MATPSPEPPAEAAAAPAEAPPAKKGIITALLPTLISVVAAPALTWAVCQFVLIPRLKTELNAAAEAPTEATPAAAAASGHGGHGKPAAESTTAKANFKFENIVVNLAGTMGTRYLKTTFLVTGTDASLPATFETNRVALVDVTINVLSSLSLADLEEAGAKNLIREKLVQSYNQTLGRKVAEQVFFSDFVVQ
jgi:flagellar FliL protein